MVTVTLVEGVYSLLVFSSETRAEADAWVDDFLLNPGIGPFVYDEATSTWVGEGRAIQITELEDE